MNKAFATFKVQPGDRVTVREWGGGLVHGTVDAVEKNVKNGLPGIVYTQDNGDGRWCYMDQIERVTRSRA